MSSIAFFSNQGGVGKTSLVYHCSWMFAELGWRVLAVDLDPQSNLSIMALEEQRLEALWPDDDHPDTLHGAVAPLFSGAGDIRTAHIEELVDGLGLLVGDLALSRIEDDLSTEWPRSSCCPWGDAGRPDGSHRLCSDAARRAPGAANQSIRQVGVETAYRVS